MTGGPADGPPTLHAGPGQPPGSSAPGSAAFPLRYQPVAPLGKGGGGEVWSVRDRLTGRTVALKVLGEGAEEREVLALVREAVALSGVEGLGVPRVLRFGRLPDGRSYLVRELVEGESLADLMGRGGEAARLLGAVALAADQLTRLHRALLLHGDIKPANIIVGADGRATLVDLGLAATWRDGGARPEGLTPRYAAPELFEGAALTVRAEVFALGATLEEVVRDCRRELALPVLEALDGVIARATLEDPAARFPSVDELASALRLAAQIAEPADPRRGLVWPVVGLDAPTSELLAQIGALRRGGGIVVTGPRGSGRTTLLRRIAWSLGVEGRKVAWVEAESVDGAGDAIAMELAPYGTTSAVRREGEPRDAHLADVVALVDDADRLGEGELARLERVREAGGRLVLVVGVERPAHGLPGQTFEVFAMRALEAKVAGELVRLTIPSLSDQVVSHVVARAGGWPGRIRATVARLEGAPVVATGDVDRLLEEDGVPQTGRGDIHLLLDRGHVDEAAEVLDRYATDRSPLIAIARARLFTSRGDGGRALLELESVASTVEGDDLSLVASFRLAAARAHLLTGNYAEAERQADELATRLRLRAQVPGLDGAAGGPQPRVGAPTPTSGVTLFAAEGAARALEGLPPAVRSAAIEVIAVRGLAQSYASRHREAKGTLDQAVGLARAVGEPRLRSLTLGSLAFALQREAQLGPAKLAYEEALKAAEQAGDAGSVANTRLNLAGIAHSQTDLAAAIRHLEAAVDMGRRAGRRGTLRQALLNLANLDLYLGRLARSRVSLDALAEERADLPAHQHAWLFALEAEYASRSGDLVTAERLCVQCAEAYAAIGRTADEAEARLERVLIAAQRPDVSPDELGEQTALAAALLQGTTAHGPLLLLVEGRVAALQGHEKEALARYGEALEAATAAGKKDLIWRALESRAQLALAAGQALRARRDREAALQVLEEIAAPLPRDLREVYWNDPRRHAVRAACLLEFASGATLAFVAPGEDRLARVLEINRAIAGEHDLRRLLEKVTDHAIALLRAERGFLLLRSGYAQRGPGAARRDLGAGSPAADDEGAPSNPGSSKRRPPAPSGTADTTADPRGPERATPGEELSIHAVRDQSGDDPHARFSQSIAERVLRSGEPVVTASAREDARMASYVSVHQLMLQSVACVPVRSRTGAVIGALYLETRLRPSASFAQEIPTLLALADQVAIAIETARLVGENERRALELEKANGDLREAQKKLEERIDHKTAQLVATRRDLRSVRAVIRSHFGYEGLVGTSEAMRRVYALIDRVKDTDVPVLVVGESGTGKEVVARAIHNAGTRGKKAFVGINCGAIPEHLLESELFGHVRGAFTGADRDRKGLFREATEGTILLDEIGEMPQKMQAGLLRVLQEKVVRPVGGSREEAVDTRVIAATHRDLSAMVEARAFREDLYYRLHVIQVRVPSLRERTEDIPQLVDHFLGIFAARYGRDRRSVSRAGLKLLAGYGWPGNVRQLENVLLNAWVLSDTPELDVDDFELPGARPQASHGGPVATPATATAVHAAPAGDPRRPAETSLDAHRAGERERILAALASCNWNRVKAAEMVGLPRRTFYRRLSEYGIQ